MWISRRRYRAEVLAGYQDGLHHGIGIGRKQIIRLLVAKARRSKVASEPATNETPASKVVVIPTAGCSVDE